MPAPDTQIDSTRRIGRYLVSAPIASGGMATVHFGALVGEAGFSRTVAVKRLHTERRSRQLVNSLLDEARLVSRVKHPNVVPTLDVVTDGGEVLVVLEYVVGETLSSLLRASEKAGEAVPVDFAVSIVAAVLHGLHAAHEATSVGGEPLGIVHRDVSPQNVMVGVDGLARVLDFGIAKATDRLSKSMAGQVKGKLAYMSPEQIRGQADRRTDIYGAAVVLWELLAGRRLFPGSTPGELLDRKIAHEVPPPSEHRADVSVALDAVVLRALAEHPDARFTNARAFALALEDSVAPVRPTEIGAWVQRLAGAKLERRAAIVAELEQAAAALTGSAPSFALASGTAEPGDAFTEEVVSSDEALPDESGTAAAPSGSAPTERAPASRGPAIGREEPAERTALSAGASRPELTHTEVAVSIPAADEAPADEAPADEAPADEAPPSRRASRVGLGLSFVLLGAALAVVWFYLRRGAETESPVGEGASTESASRAPSSSAPPSPSGTVRGAPESSVEASSSAVAPLVASSDAAGAEPEASATAVSPPVPWPVPPPVAPPPPPGSCSPPWVVDERGVRRLKPECM